MSLQVWLPLNGDLNNYGLDGSISAINVSSPVFTTGKIGQCFKANKASSDAIFNNLVGVTKYSFCTWLKIPSNETFSGWMDILLLGTQHDDSITQSSNFNGIRIEHYNVDNPGHFAIYFNKSASHINTSTSYSITSNNSSAKDKWVHLAVTNDGTKIKFYVDGVYSSEKLVANIYSTGHLNGIVRLGQSGSIGLLNDVRIYDHCLSAKEIKEISKGLVLHYPLDNNGLGNPNLVVNSQKLDNKFSTVTSAWTRSYTQEDSREEIWTATCTTAGSGGVHTAVFPKTTDKIGKQYTWSCWIKANRNISLTIGSESGGTKVKAVTTEWQYLTHTWTFTDATYQSFVWYANSASWAVGDWFKVKDLKIEEGPNATPWCPNSADSLYSSWGMNETIEKDCSGYKNHGTKAGTFLYSSSSPRSNMSTIFSGAQSIAAGRTAMVTDAITVSWWGYMDNWANYTRAISCTESGGWNFEPNNGKISFPIYRNGGYLIVVDTKALSEYAAGWHHFAATYDGYKSCLYVDGVKKVTSAVSDVKYPITYNSSNGIFVGAEAGGSTTSPAGSYFNGYISDVRIYSTALSENDIKELYQIPISIDKVGNSFAIEYDEKISPNFHKNGIIENSHIHENEADDSDSLSTFHIGKIKTFANQIYEV